MSENGKVGVFIAAMVMHVLSMFVGVAMACSDKVAKERQQAMAFRDNYLKELQQSVVSNLELQPATLVTAEGPVKQRDTAICAALPITNDLRELRKTHWVGYQPNRNPTNESSDEGMQAFPSFVAEHAYWLVPPLVDGKVISIQTTVAVDRGAYCVDTHHKWIFRFKAHRVAGSVPPRFKLERLNEVWLDKPATGGHF